MNLEKETQYKILRLASYAGKIVLQNGGEVYRVEETVTRIGIHYGLHIECFATLTCIITSLTDKKGEVISSVERIKERTNNLDKIYKLNSLARNLGEYDLGTLALKLREIDREKNYSIRINILGNIMGAALFAPLFGGGIKDIVAAGVGGLLIALFNRLASMIKINGFFINVVGGGICSTVAYIFYNLGYIENVSVVIMSTLMLLVPGVSFINSIRDVIAGDLVAGNSRVMEVTMIGMALAVGAGIALKILMRFGGIAG